MEVPPWRCIQTSFKLGLTFCCCGNWLCVLLFLALIGTLYPYNRGGLLNWLVLLYALSSVFAGYTAASFYGQFAENGWEKTVSLAGILYTGPVFVAASILNIVAISYRATTGFPFGSIVVILVLFISCHPIACIWWCDWISF